MEYRTWNLDFKNYKQVFWDLTFVYDKLCNITLTLQLLTFTVHLGTTYPKYFP